MRVIMSVKVRVAESGNVSCSVSGAGSRCVTVRGSVSGSNGSIGRGEGSENDSDSDSDSGRDSGSNSDSCSVNCSGSVSGRELLVVVDVVAVVSLSVEVVIWAVAIRIIIVSVVCSFYRAQLKNKNLTNNNDYLTCCTHEHVPADK